MSDQPEDAHSAQADHAKRRLVESIRCTAHRCSGRHHAIKLDLLDMPSLRALDELLRQVEQERDDATRRMREGGWRR